MDIQPLSFTLSTLLHNVCGQLSYDPGHQLMFSSGLFWVLFVLLMPIYAMLRSRRWQQMLFVVAFSLFFYYKSSGWCFLLMVLTSLADWHLARLIAASACRRRRLRLLVCSLVCSLGVLFFFKYTNFALCNIDALLGRNFHPLDIVLPVGISFYTFRSISYVVDVYKGRLAPERSYLNYVFFLSFFPALVAGPIVRSTHFMPQLHKPRPVTAQMVYGGLWLIMMGLVKKCVMADYLAQYTNLVFNSPATYGGIESLMAMLGYTAQIYCDFSGYSDMAIGISALLGFTIPMNFDAPWKSDSVSDFWRRWHISLSSWIRDYVYIPLGGSRKGNLRMYLNQMIAMVACGLWHGASLSFIVWGALHGALVCLHKFFSQNILHHHRHYHPHGWRRFIAIFVTFHVVCLTWLLFRNTTFEGTWIMLTQMLTKFNPTVLPEVFITYKYVFALMLFALISHWIPNSWQDKVIKVFAKGGVALSSIAIALIIFVIMQIKSSDIQPFIYFQF